MNSWKSRMEEQSIAYQYHYHYMVITVEIYANANGCLKVMFLKRQTVGIPIPSLMNKEIKYRFPSPSTSPRLSIKVLRQHRSVFYIQIHLIFLGNQKSLLCLILFWVNRNSWHCLIMTILPQATPFAHSQHPIPFSFYKIP